MIDLELNTQQIEALQLELQATESQLRKALITTLNRLARWLRTQSARGLSRQLDIQQKIIRRRLKSFRVKQTGGEFNVRVWYGLDPISFIYLNPRQNKKGVKAKRREIAGGFIADVGNGKRQVFKRKGRARLPIEKQIVEVADDATVFIEDELIGTDEFEAEFFKIFERELKWRTSKN